MLSSLTTKLALKKVGLSSNTLDFSTLTTSSPSSTGNGVNDGSNGNTWGSWMMPKSLPSKVHPWFSPPPPPVKVAPVPRIGDMAPLDRQRRLQLGRRSKCLVVFLRCVGCAFAQKTFLNLREIANRHAGSITCIAVSHASERATLKWIDMLGGAWNVQLVIDEDRAIYAAWGLGVAGSVWYVLNPTSQVQAWKETGWLGEKVAGAIQQDGGRERRVEAILTARRSSSKSKPGGRGRGGESKSESKSEGGSENGPSTELGSKWQEAGAFAVDGMGTVVWGSKAVRADDVMDLDEGAKLLLL